MAHKPSLIDRLSLRLGLAMMLALLLLVGLWLVSELVEFRRISEQIRLDGEQRQHAYLRQTVDDALAMVAYERRLTEQRVESVLRERVAEAHAIASHQVDTFGKKLARPEIEKLVRESLRPIRFNGGRGYFFAFNLDGVEQLFAARPELEGTSLMALTGARGEHVVPDMLAVVKARGEGFTRYYWTQPGKPGNDHLKISFVKRLDALGWVIGTGEYLEDTEQVIQAEVLKRLSTISVGEDGYIFVIDTAGAVTGGPLTGHNPGVEGNAQSAAILRDMRKTAESGGGTLTYDMPSGYGARSGTKVAYVALVPEWGWTIGATTYVDENNALIAGQGASLRQGILVKMTIGLVVAAALTISVLALIRFTRRQAATDSAQLEQALEDAASHLHDIDAEALKFSEHEGIAKAANTLIAMRRQAEYSLIERGHDLERMNADLERFAYITSHDLQEPLRTIQMFLQMLQRRLGDTLDDDCREYMDFAVQGARRMRDNILSLLEFSRAGGTVLTLDEVNLGSMISSVLASLRGAIEETGADIQVGTFPSIVCDSVQLSAVFLNLVSNALRYRHPGRRPHLTLSARRGDDDFWQFTVADNGIGIPEEYHEAVFEVFRRFNEPGQESGSGIGLALCRRVVEAHGGRIWLESEPGVGTTVIFTVAAARSLPKAKT